MTSKATCKCPKCEYYSGKNALVGINDLWTSHPEIAEWLANPEDGYKYVSGSMKKVLFKCPCCGEINERVIRDVVEVKHVICSFCSDNKSYPNKFIANILKSCNINFKTEYKIHPYKYFYDVYFEINNKKYVIEMDGGIGHGHKTYDGKQDNIGLEIDHIKDKIAEENMITMIRIDCDYNGYDRCKYITNSIMHSILPQLIPQIVNVDINSIDFQSSKSHMKQLLDLWNDGVRSYSIFTKETNLHRSTVRNYFKKLCELNILNLTYEEFLDSVVLTTGKKRDNGLRKQVMCIETGEVFASISDAKRTHHAGNLLKHLAGKQAYCGYLPDGTKLTWKFL